MNLGMMTGTAEIPMPYKNRTGDARAWRVKERAATWRVLIDEDWDAWFHARLRRVTVCAVLARPIGILPPLAAAGR